MEHTHTHTHTHNHCTNTLVHYIFSKRNCIIEISVAFVIYFLLSVLSVVINNSDGNFDISVSRFRPKDVSKHGQHEYTYLGLYCLYSLFMVCNWYQILIHNILTKQLICENVIIN